MSTELSIQLVLNTCACMNSADYSDSPSSLVLAREEGTWYKDIKLCSNPHFQVFGVHTQEWNSWIIW